MTERDHLRDAERLPEDAARRLLARASELEAARGAELSVAELREAAREAGIAPAAFEQALAELRDEERAVPAVPAPRRRNVLLRHWPTALIGGELLAAFLSRLIV